jgi:hypothetical protein
MHDDDSIRKSTIAINITQSRVNLRYIACFLVIQITDKIYFFKFNRLWMMDKVGKNYKVNPLIWFQRFFTFELCCYVSTQIGARRKHD